MTLADYDEWDILLNIEFEGERLKDNWKPLKISWENDKNKKSDIPQLGANFLMVNNKILSCLNNIWDKDVEILPMLYEGDDEYSLVNIYRVVNCIDFELSEYKLYKACDEIQKMKKYILKPETLDEVIIFRMDKYINGNIFATDKFKEVIEKNNISGLSFCKVWSDEK